MVSRDLAIINNGISSGPSTAPYNLLTWFQAIRNLYLASNYISTGGGGGGGGG